MFSTTRTVVTTGTLLIALAASAVMASAAPSGATAPAPTPTSTAGASRGHTSTGHIFGKEIGALARAIPAGPEHGKLVGSFARDNNPSNFKHPNRARGHAQGSKSR